MPDEKPDAPKEEPKGDGIDQMINAGLKARDAAQADRKAADEPKTPTSEEQPPESEEEEGGKPPDQDKPKEEPEPTLEEIQEENRRLKEKLGKQGNQVGTLREQLSELGEMLDGLKTTTHPSDPDDPVTAQFKRLSAKYGEEFARDIMETAMASAADLRTDRILSTYRKKYEDFDELQTEMAGVLTEGGPELQEAVRKRPALIEMIYRAAKANKLTGMVSDAELKGATLAEKRALQKRAADAERPNAALDKGPLPFDRKAEGQKRLDAIMKARSDGR